MLKVAFSENYFHPLPRNHRFPMSKYELLPEQLLHEGTIKDENLFRPESVSEKHILNTHKAEYWDKLKNGLLTASEIRRTGFPFSSQLVTRETTIMNGTLMAADFALEYGIAMNVAGGTHHAFTNRGEGFCLLNDIAIAANYLLKTEKVNKILVVDLDVHQGNGTAEIFSNNDAVFTFSMHAKNNYPLNKEKSDLDIALPDGVEDKEYLTLLRNNLSLLIDTHQPEFIFFQSGVDILDTDKLGKLKVSKMGCKERDRIVLGSARANNIPLVASMGGGYSPKFSDIIDAHANTFRLAQEIFF